MVMLQLKYRYDREIDLCQRYLAIIRSNVLRVNFMWVNYGSLICNVGGQIATSLITMAKSEQINIHRPALYQVFIRDNLQEMEVILIIT